MLIEKASSDIGEFTPRGGEGHFGGGEWSLSSCRDLNVTSTRCMQSRASCTFLLLLEIPLCMIYIVIVKRNSA